MMHIGKIQGLPCVCDMTTGVPFTYTHAQQPFILTYVRIEKCHGDSNDQRIARSCYDNNMLFSKKKRQMMSFVASNKHTPSPPLPIGWPSINLYALSTVMLYNHFKSIYSSLVICATKNSYSRSHVPLPNKRSPIR